MMRFLRYFSEERGFSILESVMTTSIALIVLVGSAGLIAQDLNVISSSRHLAIAYWIASDKLEEISQISRETTIQRFPGGQKTAVSDLPNGEWYVDYPDGTAADPLKVDIYVKWKENNGQRQRSFKLSTLKTSGL